MTLLPTDKRRQQVPPTVGTSLPHYMVSLHKTITSTD